MFLENSIQLNTLPLSQKSKHIFINYIMVFIKSIMLTTAIYYIQLKNRKAL
jgi:hypothetical protein